MRGSHGNKYVSIIALTIWPCKHQSAYLYGMNSSEQGFTFIVIDIIIPIFTDEKTEAQGSSKSVKGWIAAKWPRHDSNPGLLDTNNHSFPNIAALPQERVCTTKQPLTKRKVCYLTTVKQPECCPNLSPTFCRSKEAFLFWHFLFSWLLATICWAFSWEIHWY